MVAPMYIKNDFVTVIWFVLGGFVKLGLALSKNTSKPYVQADSPTLRDAIILGCNLSILGPNWVVGLTGEGGEVSEKLYNVIR